MALIRSCKKGHLDASDVDFGAEAPPDLGFRSGFEEQTNCLLKVCTCFLDRIALAGDVDFGTQCRETVSFALDDSRQLGRDLMRLTPTRPQVLPLGTRGHRTNRCHVHEYRQIWEREQVAWATAIMGAVGTGVQGCRFRRAIWPAW